MKEKYLQRTDSRIKASLLALLFAGNPLGAEATPQSEDFWGTGFREPWVGNVPIETSYGCFTAEVSAGLMWENTAANVAEREVFLSGVFIRGRRVSAYEADEIPGVAAVTREIEGYLERNEAEVYDAGPQGECDPLVS